LLTDSAVIRAGLNLGQILQRDMAKNEDIVIGGALWRFNSRAFRAVNPRTAALKGAAFDNA
jgi:hypothetical protein